MANENILKLQRKERKRKKNPQTFGKTLVPEKVYFI